MKILAKIVVFSPDWMDATILHRGRKESGNHETDKHCNCAPKPMNEYFNLECSTNFRKKPDDAAAKGLIPQNRQILNHIRDISYI